MAAGGNGFIGRNLVEYLSRSPKGLRAITHAYPSPRR
jgi:nucleoside-diphosphate-sugar epimerase